MKTPIDRSNKLNNPATPSWLRRLTQWLGRRPKNREQLKQVLQEGKRHGLLDEQALKMIEGVLQISNRHVRDIMVPCAKMTVIHENARLEEILPIVIESAHSRFPVISASNGEVVGLLLAKDLLRYNPLEEQSRFQLANILRPAIFIPESKRLNSLLEEFKDKHYHMAIVVDEYGSVSGLITIEDVLEEIVGEIEDEYDEGEEIFVREQASNRFVIKALMPIESFNVYFNAHLGTDQFDTIGGYIANRFGYLPKRGARLVLPPFQFKILRADNRQIRLLEMTLESTQQ